MEEKIVELLRSRPGLKARDIAAALGVDRTVINSALYGRLKARLHQDKSYRWYLKDSQPRPVASEQAEVAPDTPLARLCKYYLQCLSHDSEYGVSVFAQGSFGLDYAETDVLPFVSDTDPDPFSQTDCRQLLNKVRGDRSRLTLCLGYPVRLRHYRSQKGWEGRFVEPIFLFQFLFDPNDRYATPTLSDDLPVLNFKALKWLNTLGAGQLMEEAIQLADELGLVVSPDGEVPDLDEVFQRLQRIRPEWDWRESPDPHALSQGNALSALDEAGIYNRAVMVVGERSPYTQGLESELGDLSRLNAERVENTALGAWLATEGLTSPTPEPGDIVEVVPLNTEQRQAVVRGLSNPLTVITGPPGTGKSQVVTSLLINAAWRGKRVLFASKNNKAVDVVEVRVNALGPRPILLRLGANEYQNRLADYLTSMLATAAGPDDEARFQEHLAIHREIRSRLDRLEESRRALIDSRNIVDRLEQAVEESRALFGEDKFAALKGFDDSAHDEQIMALDVALRRAYRKEQNLIVRLFWPRFKQDRFEALSAALHAVAGLFSAMAIAPPCSAPSDSAMPAYSPFLAQFKDRLLRAKNVAAYFRALDSLRTLPSLEELTAEQVTVTQDIADNSENLWHYWLVLQPGKLTRDQRRLLSDYAALLQMIARSREQGGRLDAQVYRRYRESFPQVTSVLSCWAVTSLSARGGLPLQPGFFDILIIDEASQCDIASALPLLFRAKSAVIIGDPNQLRHISQISIGQDRQLLAENDLVGSYASWAYSVNSFFDLARGLCGAEDIIALRDHHRSHADIIGFSNKEFYEGRLRIATRYDRLVRPSLQEPAVRWLHVAGQCTRPAAGGAVNDVEAQTVVREVEDLVVRRGYRGSVGVVSPFRGQANRIRELISGNPRLSQRLAEMDLLVDTVNRFQGDERDVMFFSPVVSRGLPDGAKGFLQNNKNLFNVAITRARSALIVVGDLNAAQNSGVDYLARFALYTQQLGRDHDEHTRPLDDLGHDYPTVARPELVSQWERVFYRVMYEAGLRPVPQYDEEQYTLDFAMFHQDQKLDIEVDGERYHRNWDGELCRRDVIRNQRLLELGWDVKRFWVYELRDNMRECVSWLLNWQQSAARTSSSPSDP